MTEPASADPAGPAASRLLGRRIAGQGALLFTGFATAQALSFGRNAIVGHWLSKGDFGIAATVTLALQLLDTLSDLGPERLVVSAEDGDSARFCGTAHTLLLARGVLTALVLFALAGPAAAFFHAPHAIGAFQLAALVPLIKGLLHLDHRRFQRRYSNGAFVAVEVVPQALALAATPVLLLWLGDVRAVVAAALVQATVTLLVSQAVAERRYALAFDAAHLRRLIAFGWPIWLSAFPLVAVYQGDRVLIGRLLGLEALAGYTVAFMVTMVPGLVAAKVGTALMLPLLAEVRTDPARMRARALLMTEAVVLIAGLYLVLFLVAGEAILPIAFGASYQGLGALAGWLAAMWAVRMIQAVPGMALMAAGRTRPLLVAGTIRATGLLLAVAAIGLGGGVELVAAGGLAAELASLLVMAKAMGQILPGAGAALLLRTALLAPVAAATLAAGLLLPTPEGLAALLATAGLASLAVAALCIATMPALRGLTRGGLVSPR